MNSRAKEFKKRSCRLTVERSQRQPRKFSSIVAAMRGRKQKMPMKNFMPLVIPLMVVSSKTSSTYVTVGIEISVA